jgi:hypothetical protein
METITPPAVDKISLGNCGTDTSTVAAQGRAAAFGLALIVGEDEEVIRANLNRGACQRLIGVITTEALRSRREACCHITTIIAANGRRSESTGAQHIHEALTDNGSTLGLTSNKICCKVLTNTLGPVSHTHQHEEVRQEEERKHTNEIPTASVHSN